MGAELPGASPVSVGGIALPRGHPLYPKRRFGDDGHGPAPVIWATEDEVDGAALVWRAISQRLPTGLVAVLLEGFAGDPRRPWDAGEFRPPGPGWERPGAAEVLEAMWASVVPHDGDLAEVADLVSPFGHDWPGLAPPTRTPAHDSAVGLALSAQPPARIALVSADEPADVPEVVGWLGAANYGYTPAQLSSVLRSWQVRFGARLLKIGFQTLYLLVERPPAEPAEAMAVASEYFSFCPDSVYQGAGSVACLAGQLLGATVWGFWWD